MLVPDYGSDGESEEDEAGRALPPTVIPPAVLHPAEDAEESDEESDEESVNEEAGAAEEVVLPVALTVESDEDDEEDGTGPDPEEDAPTLNLPTPDFSDWDQPVHPTAPLVQKQAAKRQRVAGGPSHISKGFTAAVTRHDQLKAAAAAELEDELEQRANNNGFSKAHDSVFRAPEGDDDTGPPVPEKRTKVNRQGKVRAMSKKEIAQDDALLESLR